MRLTTLKIAIAALLGVAAWACSEPNKFTITGTINGNQSMNLYMKYYDGERVRENVSPATEGKFEITGSSKVPTLVEIMDNEYHVLGRLYLTNGDKVRVVLDRRNPYLMQGSGTEVMEEWTRVLNANADTLSRGSAEAVNEVVERYVADNPTSVVSTLLFATSYVGWAEPERADSVFNMIDASVRDERLLGSYAASAMRYAGYDHHALIDSIPYRPYKRDTVLYFTPQGEKSTLLSFTRERTNNMLDTIMPALDKLAKKDKMRVIDIMLVPDTNTWRRITGRDSTSYTRAWVPGGVFANGVDKLAIPKLPFFIVVDTAGHQLYRGQSLAEAEAAVD